MAIGCGHDYGTQKGLSQCKGLQLTKFNYAQNIFDF
jgi:hypothetical protein